MTYRDREAEAVRAALEELRAAESRRLDATAPSFHSVLTRYQTRTPQRFSPARLALAVATVATIAIMALGYRGTFGRPERLIVPKEVAALAAWRPITDVLLETPGRNLLRETPSLEASIINVP